MKFSRALEVLEQLDLFGDSIPAFIKEEVTFKVVSRLTESDLSSVGLQAGKVRLDRVIAYLKVR